MLAKLAGDLASEVYNAALDCTVVGDGDLARADAAEQRCVIDDAAVAGFDHFLAELADAAEHAGELKVKTVLPEIIGSLGDGIERAAACIVDEDIDLAELVDSGLDGCLYIVKLADVALDGQALNALCPYLLCDRIELFHAACKQDDICALTCQCERKLTAKAARCAGDNCYSTMKIKHIVPPLPYRGRHSYS